MAMRDLHPNPPILDPLYSLVEVSHIGNALTPKNGGLHVDKVVRAKPMKKPPRSVPWNWKLIAESFPRFDSTLIDDLGVTICDIMSAVFLQDFKLAGKLHRHPDVVCVAEFQIFALSRSYSVVPRPGRG